MIDQRTLQRHQTAQAEAPANAPRVAGPRQAALSTLAKILNPGPMLQRKTGGTPINDDKQLEREADQMGQRAASLSRRRESDQGGMEGRTDKVALSEPENPKKKTVLQGQFPSIRMARGVFQDPQSGIGPRFAAETHLRQADGEAVAAIREDVAAGRFQQALTTAVTLSGLPAGSVVRPTTDYHAVIEGADIPRGTTPSGVTVMEQGAPVIYIHEDNIRKWVDSGDIGNLLATIRHEAKHAEQNRRPGDRRGDDEREFEAYATEITHAQELFDAGEDSLAPTSAHLAVSYNKAMEHYNALANPPAALAAIRVRIVAQYPRLRRYLEDNDRESGRVSRIADATRAALRGYIQNPSTEYPRFAFNEYSKIPERFRLELDAEFDPLFDEARELMLRQHQGGGSRAAAAAAK